MKEGESSYGRKTVPFKAGCRMLGLRKETFDNPKEGRYVNKVKLVFIATFLAAAALVACLAVLSIMNNGARGQPVERYYQETISRLDIVSHDLNETTEAEESNATESSSNNTGIAEPLRYLIISPRRPKALERQPPYFWRRVPTSYTDRFAQLEGYRQPRRVHSAEDILRYLRADRTPAPPPPPQPAVKLAGLYFLAPPPADDMDTAASGAGPTFVAPDPLNRYKPQHPAEVNFLATAENQEDSGVRFSTRGRPAKSPLYTEAVFHGAPVADRRQAVDVDSAQDEDEEDMSAFEEAETSLTTSELENNDSIEAQLNNDSTPTTEIPSSSKANFVKREDSYTQTTAASKTLAKEAVSVTDWNQGRKRKKTSSKEGKEISDGGEIIRSIEYSFTLPEVAASAPNYKEDIYKLDDIPLKMPDAMKKSGYLSGNVGDFGEAVVTFSQKDKGNRQRNQERRQPARTTTPQTITITPSTQQFNSIYTSRNKDTLKENNLVHYKVPEPNKQSVQYVPVSKEVTAKKNIPLTVEKEPYYIPTTPVTTPKPTEVYYTTQKSTPSFIERPTTTVRPRTILRTNPRSKVRGTTIHTTEEPRTVHSTLGTTNRPVRKRRPVVHSKVMTRTKTKEVSTIEHLENSGPSKEKSKIVTVYDKTEYPHLVNRGGEDANIQTPSYKSKIQYIPVKESYDYEYSTPFPQNDYTTDPIVFIVPKRLMRPRPKQEVTTENSPSYEEVSLQRYHDRYTPVDVTERIRETPPTAQVRETLPSPQVYEEEEEEEEEEETVPSTTENSVISSSRASILLGDLGQIFRSVAYPKGAAPEVNSVKNSGGLESKLVPVRTPVRLQTPVQQQKKSIRGQSKETNLSHSINNIFSAQYSVPKEDFENEPEEIRENPVKPRVRIFRQKEEDQSHEDDESKQSWQDENRRSGIAYEEFERNEFVEQTVANDSLTTEKAEEFFEDAR